MIKAAVFEHFVFQPACIDPANGWMCKMSLNSGNIFQKNSLVFVVSFWSYNCLKIITQLGRVTEREILRTVVFLPFSPSYHPYFDWLFMLPSLDNFFFKSPTSSRRSGNTSLPLSLKIGGSIRNWACLAIAYDEAKYITYITLHKSYQIELQISLWIWSPILM